MALSGLVSYGSSDESENESESESTPAIYNSNLAAQKPSSLVRDDAKPSTSASNNVLLDNLIDDDAVDDVVQGPSVPTGLGLPKPIYSKGKDIETDIPGSNSAETSHSGSSVLASLPNPTISRVKKLQLQAGEDIVEEEFKKLPQNAELPKATKKAGKVRIAMPELPTSDSDEDEPKAKRPRPSASAGKSGLLGLLPQPKNFSVKETNRALVPHTLTKKSTALKPKVKPNSMKGKTVSLVDAGSDDSDNDDNVANFFSFANKKNDTVAATGTEFAVQAAPKLPAPILQDPKPRSNSSFNAHPKRVVHSSLWSASSATVSQVAPSATVASAPYNGSMLPIQPPYDNLYQQNYPQPQTHLYDPQEETSGSTVDFETHQKLIQDDQFKRMCGKDFRGQEIDILDVNAEDQMSNQIDITKSLTEESSNMSYSKKRKDMPSSLSRRKHQITYLAFQAKERELDLKNQWAENKMTRRQTQSKYGF